VAALGHGASEASEATTVRMPVMRMNALVQVAANMSSSLRYGKSHEPRASNDLCTPCLGTRLPSGLRRTAK
jgi:hypothetical protein